MDATTPTPEDSLISIVDDDASVRRSTGRLIRSFGFRSETFRSGEELLSSGRTAETGCLILDVRMPGMGGLELQQRLIADQSRIPIVFLTARASNDEERQARHAGAVEILRKPVSKEMLRRVLRTVLGRADDDGTDTAIDTPLSAYTVEDRRRDEELVGASASLHTALRRVAKVAPTDATVLISGETGSGKELIARAIHSRSARAAGPFVAVNCAAFPAPLIASELFGHERGAFTGALQRRIGRFEQAEGGTLFLDEIGELGVETQIALLRVLQEREFERLGSHTPIRADVRVLAATNRDLSAAIAEGSFRSDLYYRLNVFPLEVPPLRERRDDIPLLIEHFVRRYASRAGKSIRFIDRRTLDMLRAYDWPGNIRELQNVVERSVIVCETDTLEIDEAWLWNESTPEASLVQPLANELALHEKALIEAALAATRGRVSGPSGAAVRLGIPASTLDSKIRTLNISKERFKISRGAL